MPGRSDDQAALRNHASIPEYQSRAGARIPIVHGGEDAGGLHTFLILRLALLEEPVRTVILITKATARATPFGVVAERGFLVYAKSIGIFH